MYLQSVTAWQHVPHHDAESLDVPERLALALYVTAARDSILRLPKDLSVSCKLSLPRGSLSQGGEQLVINTLNVVLERVAQIVETVVLCQAVEEPSGAPIDPCAPLNLQSCYLTLHNELAKIVHLVDSAYSLTNEFTKPNDAIVLRLNGSCHLAANTLQRLQQFVLHEVDDATAASGSVNTSPASSTATSPRNSTGSMDVFLCDDYELGIEHLLEMGFSREQAAPAIIDAKGDVLAALSLLLSVEQDNDVSVSPQTIRKRFSLLSKTPAAAAKPVPKRTFASKGLARKRTLSPPRRSGSMKLKGADLLVAKEKKKKSAETKSSLSISLTVPQGARPRSRSLGRDEAQGMLTLTTPVRQQRPRLYTSYTPPVQGSLWPEPNSSDDDGVDIETLKAGAEQLSMMGFDRLQSESRLRMNSMNLEATLDDLLAMKSVDINHDDVMALMDEDEDDHDDDTASYSPQALLLRQGSDPDPETSDDGSDRTTPLSVCSEDALPVPPPRMMSDKQSKVAAITAMGFSEQEAEEALEKESNSVRLAVDFLLHKSSKGAATRSRSNSCPEAMAAPRLTDHHMERQRDRAFTVATKFSSTNPFKDDAPAEAEPESPADHLLDEDLQFKVDKNGERRLRAGTLPAFLDYLISDANDDPDLLHSFITCFHLFTSVEAVLELLFQKHVAFMSCRKHGKCAESDQRGHKRVCTVLAELVSAGWKGFTPEHLDELRVLVFDLVRVGLLKAAQQVRRAEIHSRQFLQAELLKASKPAPSVPLSAQQVFTHPPTIFEVPSIDLARQITLVDSELFCSITSRQVLAWSKKQDRGVSPSIFKMIERFNKMSKWVTTLIITQRGLRERVRMLNKLVGIMRSLKKLRNFNSLMAFLAGIGASPVARLSHTFEALNTRARATLDKTRQLMAYEKSYSTYRKALSTCSLPVIPYLGIYLTDVTFVHHGNPDTVVAEHNVDLKLINFAKVSTV